MIPPRRWTPEEDALVQSRYATCRVADLAAEMGRSAQSVKTRAAKLGIQHAREKWSAEDEAVMRAEFPHVRTADLAVRLGRKTVAVQNFAYKLGLRKSQAFLYGPESGRLNAGEPRGVEFRFQPGQTPANKGLRRKGWGPGRMRETQFKKGGPRSGKAALVYQPIGAERISADGYLERKVNDDLPFNRRWRAVHALLWEATHGPVPAGHSVAFKNRDKTDIRLDNLELVSRAELMRRNTVHNYPKPVVQAIHALGALTRQIRQRERHAEKQD
jgi:hypothetical protein